LAIYESMLIFSGRLETQEVEQEIEKVRNLVESGNGSIHAVERMGRRRLAYDIRKESDGHYAVFHFEDDPARIPALHRAFRLNEAILRFTVFRKERLPDGPTVALMEEEPHARGDEDRPPRRARGEEMESERAERAKSEVDEPRGESAEREN